MSRGALPSCPPVPARRTSQDFPTLQLKMAVATPMFGGGVSPGQIDASLPIRASSIRGHLRFWWRATCGAEFNSVNKLREEEAKVWGCSEQRSAVETCVSISTEGPGIAYPPNALKYVLFPFTHDGWRDIEFTLDLRYPASLREQVETALRAWVNFGGIGARTRRGCGALYCGDFALRTVDEVRDAFRWSATCHGWPVLGDFQIGGRQRTPMDSWQHAVGIMKEFRQGEYGRNWIGSVPHLSRWPEADSLRRITGKFLDPGHRPSANGPCAFPRAELGLPIQFQFKHRDDKANNCELLPVDDRGAALTRMASPIILRPLVVAARQAFAMLVILNTPGVTAARFKTTHKDRDPDPSPLLNGRDVTASEIRNTAAASQPGFPLAGSASALAAFLSYARSEL